MSKRLRIVNVIVQPVVVWDDGDALTPGPEINAVTVAASELVSFAASLPAQIAQIEAQAAAPENEEGE